MTLQQKVLDKFIGKVVRKDLAFLVKGGLPVPTYVLEYLLGQYCASDDIDLINDGLAKVKQVIQNNYVHRAEAETVKGKIRDKGVYRIIDKITANLNERSDIYQATFANLGLTGIPISTEWVKKNPKLLSGNGVWCIVTIGYISGEDVKTRWELQNLKPIQISNIDLQEYIEQRQHFTTNEWIDLLIHTVGMNPDVMNRREKLITLARLLPHVENNFNLIELGPKGTGKSHVFQELSPYGVLISGGDITSARLFVRMSGKREELGLVGYWDVVTWDEFEQQPQRHVDSVLIDTMQNYLANKSFNRGKSTHEASASMVFVGNTKHSPSYMLKNSHLFESIPTSFLKGAFLDRIHLYSPGWEIKILKKDSFSQGYGLITDYIAAVLHALRNDDRTSLLSNYAKFDGSLSERDHLAIRKTFSGMLKLIYPDGNLTDEEAFELIDFATECRKRVKDQIYIIDETFKVDPATFKYINLKKGKEVYVETLENIENNHFVTFDKNNAYKVLTTPPYSTVESASTTHANALSTPNSDNILLEPKTISIRENQCGITYQSLLGDYFREAKEISLTDPFIRYPYQVDNLIDFIQMIKEVSNYSEELKIHLSTQNDNDEKVAELIDNFDDLVDDLASYGITFTYDFNAEHDRIITTDTGWIITLGRGLDIFEKYNRFSLSRSNQKNRRCKAFTISINKRTNEQ